MRANAELLVSPIGLKLIIILAAESRFVPEIIEYMVQTTSLEHSDLDGMPMRTLHEILRREYFPKLRLISYSMEKDKSGIRIYSHAPIDLVIVQKIASRLGIEYKDDTVESLGQTIDAINREFQANYIEPVKARNLFDRSRGPRDDQDMSDQTNPFNFLVWNRNYFQLNFMIISSN